MLKLCIYIQYMFRWCMDKPLLYVVHLKNNSTENIKTREQKDQEAKLLQELLRTVEERNNIKQRKMNTQVQ